MASLSNKQEQFCLEYLIDLNATQAAIRAGYSKKTAQEIGSQNLSKVMIRDRVGKLMSERADRVLIHADYVIDNIKAIAETARDGLEHSSALRGYELLGKHLKMFTDKQEHEIKGDLAVTKVTRTIVKS